MRISQVEFKLGKRGTEYPAVLEAIPEDGGIDYIDLRKAYEQVTPRPASTFDTVLGDLESGGLVDKRTIGPSTFYQRRKFWSSRDVADFLGVSERTVQVWAQEGKLPSVRIGGRLRFLPGAIEELISSKRANRGPITTAEDPVLADLWDNEADSAYDNL